MRWRRRSTHSWHISEPCGITSSPRKSGDIRGAELYGAKDEKLGKIDDVIFDHTSGSLRYAVVDTGGWLQ